jgi:integrase
MTPLAMKSLQRSMAEAKDRRTGRSLLCRGTINSYLARIRQMFKWGVSEGLVPVEVWHGLTAVRGLARGRSAAREKDPVGPVPDLHVEATLAHLSAVVADMVRLQRVTGMRPGEVCIMTAAELDTSGPVWLYRPRHHKTAHHGKERVVPLGPKAQMVLKPYLSTELALPLFRPEQSERLRLEDTHTRRVTPMTPSQRERGARTGRRRRKRAPGEAYTVASYRRAITRAAERAGVPAWSPNRLRHAKATELRRAFGLDAAGAVLGHSKLETTQVYAERSLELAERAALATG